MTVAEQIMQANGYDGNMANVTPPAPPAQPAAPAIAEPPVEIPAQQVQPQAQNTPLQDGNNAPDTSTANATTPDGAASADPQQSAAAEPLPQQVQPHQAEPQLQQPVQASVSEDAVIAFLKEKLGRDINSIDELNTPAAPLTEEQKLQKEQERRDNITAFALNNKLYNSQDLQQYNTDINRSAQDIAYELFSDNYKQTVNSAATEEQIREDFEIWAALHADESNPVRKIREAEMQAAKNAYIDTKHAKIITAANDFDAYQDVMQKGKAYTNAVNEIFGAMGDGKEPYTTSFSFGDESFAFKFSPEAVNSARERIMNEESFKKLGLQQGMDKNTLSQAVQNAMIVQHLPEILKTVAEAYHSKKVIQAGAEKIGIDPTRQAPYNAGEQARSTKTSHADAIMQQSGYSGMVNATA